MTLYKQLIILIIALFLILFMSVFYISSNHLKEYINTQLSSHAQDAATSLGIAISAEMIDKDLANIETHVNAMFDSGYYQKIVIIDANDKELFSKQRDLTDIDGVPNWLLNLFPLDTPQQTAAVMNGWTPAGAIQVISFPEFAYHNLWNNIKSLFSLFALTILSLFLVSSIALRTLLKPLSEIEKQAKAISQRKFTTLDIAPATTEFNRVVIAMNTMSAKLKAIFSEQAALTEELKKQAFQDEVTGLSNRAVFMKQLKYFSESDEEKYQGCLLIMQINNLLEINKKHGHLKGNELLIAIADMYQQLSEDYHQSFVARISGTEFAIIIKSISPEQLKHLGDTIQDKLNEIAKKLHFDDIAHSGIILTYPEQSMGAMLSEADMALRLAQQKGLNAYHIYDEHQEGMTVYGAAQWHDIILKSIDNNNFKLHFQPVVNSKSEIIQKEAMIRLYHDDQLISAGIFIPMAEYLGITRFVDQWVIKQVLNKIKEESHPTIIYSVNLSQDSLKDPEFPDWLKRQLDEISELQQQRLVFEVPEYNVNKFFSEWRNLINKLELNHCQYCIDHFGVGFSNINYLNDITVDYIKIHGSFAKEIEDMPEVSTYIRQVVSMSHSQDILVIAEGIENEIDFETLQSLKMDLFQGYHLGRPVEE